MDNIKEIIRDNPNLFLDTIFNAVHEESSMGWAASDIQKNLEIDKIHMHYITSALLKIESDGYIKRTNLEEANTTFNGTKFLITFHGRLFRENNGYQHKAEMEKIKEGLLKLDAIERRRYGQRLLCATWFAGIAGMLLVLIEFYKLLCH
jgi:hypothetical protein